MDGEEIEDLIDQWHAGAGGNIDLHLFLGWTLEEYRRWVATCRAPVRS